MHDDPQHDGRSDSQPAATPGRPHVSASDPKPGPIEAPPVELGPLSSSEGVVRNQLTNSELEEFLFEPGSGPSNVPDRQPTLLSFERVSLPLDSAVSQTSASTTSCPSDAELDGATLRIDSAIGGASSIEQAASDERSERVERSPRLESSSRSHASSPKRTSRRHQPDPLTQSLTLLATIAVMLLAARFVVPRIVEEVRYAWHRGELRAEYESGTNGLQNVSLDALSEAYQMVTAAVGPSVVHIDVQRRPSMDVSGMAAELLGSAGPGLTDQGSGVIVDEEGYLLTNRHVIAGGEDITVTLSDGRRVTAMIVGTDALTDLAVLKIDATRLMPITWGDSDRCKVGSPVWAVGSPFGLDRTVTFGILSGKHRMVRASTQYQDFMQSDVAVNPGNSGGPLVDARGTLVGINTAIVGETYQGVSFSIPSNVAHQVYDQLRETGRVQRGWLGVKLDEVAYDPSSDGDPLIRGARVGYVTASDSPAALAGLQPGDVINAVDDKPVRDMAHLMRMIGDSIAGSEVLLGVVREQAAIQVPVRLGARPEALNGN